MDRIEKHFYRNVTRYRRIVQFCGFLLILIIPLLITLGYRKMVGTYYSISFWELDMTDPAMVLQHLFLTREIFFTVLLSTLIPVGVALLAGRVFCSWICPYNLLAEFADRLRRKVRPSSVRVQNSNPRAAIYWSIFGVIIAVVALAGIPLISFISFPGLISAQTSDLILAGELGLELVLVPAVLIIEIFLLERFWCRFACPVGATLGLFRTPGTLSVSYEGSKCRFQCSGGSGRAVCNEACPVQLNPKRSGLYPYCYNCGACIEACQTQGGSALQFRFGFQKTERNETTSS